MKIKLIRNATLQLNYGGRTFLIDPFLAPQGAMPPFPNTPNQNLRNPTAPLPVDPEHLAEADAVFITHLHPDHFDEDAKAVLSKETALYAQNAEDVEAVQKAGFTHVHSFQNGVDIDGIRITRTPGRHGSEEMTAMTGKVSGLLFEAEGEKSLYIAGDTVWYEEIEQTLASFRPEVIVVNAGAAQFLEGGPITMTKEDVKAVSEAAPESEMVAVHMESLNHCLLTRDELKSYMSGSPTLHVPEDGETLTF
ncbi:MBL fold metallo-hydrolase [Halobacillus litoralis]|uniref:MBL fold metallo-hydrolase n=1 Tax=Halobacillus litoralis TaxID=45668 RepID=A0A845DNP9_9BACI|nr:MULTISPECIES: MBL fold metallo-hydrolase [Halobacillus]MYL18559.1 MBL fold metallo-hydrolase [Halobacillus litoralis]MYL30433.1 MBL fold metallo-hydrolase [Halobacillus halophilus]